MSGHTKGQWTANGESIKCGVQPIACVWTPRRPNEARLDGESWLDMRERTKPEREAIEIELVANARLIASAPDLLAERDRLKALNAGLVEALEFIEGLYSYEARAGENASALYEACCMARAALAKHKKETA